MSNATTTVTDICADPLCMGEATHDMISRVPGHRTKMCADHRKKVLAAAKKAGFSAEKIASLDIKPLRGAMCSHCGHPEVDHTEADGGESRCPHCDCPEYAS